MSFLFICINMFLFMYTISKLAYVCTKTKMVKYFPTFHSIFIRWTWFSNENFTTRCLLSGNFLSLCMCTDYNFLWSIWQLWLVTCVCVCVLPGRGYDRGQGLVAEWQALSNLASCPGSRCMLAWGSDPVISVVIETPSSSESRYQSWLLGQTWGAHWWF